MFKDFICHNCIIMRLQNCLIILSPVFGTSFTLFTIVHYLGYFFIEFLACQTLNVPRQIRPSCEIRWQKYLSLLWLLKKTDFFAALWDQISSKCSNFQVFEYFCQKIFSGISTSLVFYYMTIFRNFHKKKCLELFV